MKVVIDTDAGVDDAIALMMAVHGLPNDVVAATTVFGNVNIQQATHNTQHVLETAGRKDIPVYSGASRPIVSSISDYKWDGHGADGMGNQLQVIEDTGPQKNVAVEKLIDLSHRYEKELTIIAIGPLTNIALAILLDPTITSRVKQFIVMGGLSRGEGNHGPHAEYNVGCDPEATNIVYQHCTADQLVIVPWETCIDHALPWSVFDQVFSEEAAPTGHGPYIHRIWQFTRKLLANEGFAPCDAYAVALLDSNYVIESKKMHGRIHLAHDEYRGANEWNENEHPNATVVTKVDKDVFTTLLRRLAA